MRKLTLSLFVTLLACLFALSAQAQVSFTWTIEHHVLHATNEPEVSFLEFNGILTNTGDAADNYTIYKEDLLPPGSFTWQASICIGDECFAPFVNEVTTASVDPGADLDIHLAITIGQELGSAYGLLTVESVDDPRVSVTETFAAIHDDCDALVVDDTDETYGAYTSFDALAAAMGEKVAGHWPRNLALPTLADLQTWPMVIWTADVAPTLEADDRSLLGNFLGAGGSLLLAGEDIAYDLCDAGSPNQSTEACEWLDDHCGIAYAGDSGSAMIDGVAGSDVGDGLSFTLAGGADPDLIVLTQVGAIQFESVGSGATGALQSGFARQIYLGFNLANVPAPSLSPLMAMACAALAPPSASDTPALPAGLVLRQNQPNPFNPKTNLRFAAATGGMARVEVMDVTGRQVAAFSAEVAAGENSLPFDGNGLASGTYLYRVLLGDEVAAGKMTLLK